jgi:predicted dehydrogenase
VEVFSNGSVYIIDDFKTFTIHANGGKKEKKLLVQDKGQKNEVKGFVDAILTGSGPVIPFEEIYASTLVTLKILESARTGRCVTVALD